MRPVNFLLLPLALVGCGPASTTSTPDPSSAPRPPQHADGLSTGAPPASDSTDLPASLRGSACGSGGQSPSLLAGMTPAAPVNSVELRKIIAGDEPETQTSEAVGIPCAGASDKTACQAAVERATSDKGFGHGCPPMQCHEVLVYTRGEQAGVVDTVEGLLGFLGPISSESEVALLLRAQRYNVGDCAAVQAGGILRTDFGWTVKASKRIADCPVEYSDFEINVTTAGELLVVSEKRRPMEGKACI